MSPSHQARYHSKQCVSDHDGNDDNGDLSVMGTSTVATKRLFSNRTSVPLGPKQPDASPGYDGADHQYEATPPKRHRSSGWPLPNPSPATAVCSRRNATRSPPIRQSTYSQPRSSRFVEGSMKDRVSQKPPIPYLGEVILDGCGEAAHSESRGRGRPGVGHSTHHAPLSVVESPTTHKFDTSRQSGLFRFGKSLAATFNLGNLKFWNKQPRQVEETPKEKILRERKATAERIYQQIKASGNFRGFMHGFAAQPPRDEDEMDSMCRRSSSLQAQDGAVQASTCRRASSQQPSNRVASSPPHRRATSQQPLDRAQDSKHDSGVSFGAQSTRRISYESSQGSRRNGRVFLDTPKILQGTQSPSASGDGHGGITKRRSLHFRKPSLSNLSQHDSEQSDSAGQPNHQARRVPSRKDLQKQQKLVKRVSDLESKLDAARRQLNVSLHESVSPPTTKAGKSRFIPGALASLPSERLLTGYLDPDEEAAGDEGLQGIGQAVTTDQPWLGLHMPADTVKQNESELDDEGEKMQRVSCQPVERPETDKSLLHSPEKQVDPQLTPDSARDIYDHSGAGLTGKIDIGEAGHSPPSRTVSKKRKTIGSAEEDDFYKPSADTESEDLNSEPRGTQKHVNRPRKLVKTQDQAIKFNASADDSASTPEARKSSANAHKSAAKRGQIKGAVHTPPRSRMSKSKIPRRSTSPPLDLLAGLEYSKPSERFKALAPRNILAKVDTTVNPALLEDDRHVPPVPVVPKTVRLASGEVVNTAPSNEAPMKEGSNAALGATSTKIKTILSNSKKLAGGMENSERAQASSIADDWPDYVF